MNLKKKANEPTHMIILNVMPKYQVQKFPWDIDLKFRCLWNQTYTIGVKKDQMSWPIKNQNIMKMVSNKKKLTTQM